MDNVDFFALGDSRSYYDSLSTIEGVRHNLRINSSSLFIYEIVGEGSSHSRSYYNRERFLVILYGNEQRPMVRISQGFYRSIVFKNESKY